MSDYEEYSRFKEPTIESIERALTLTTPGEWLPWGGQPIPEEVAECLGIKENHWPSAWGITAESVPHSCNGDPKIILCRNSNDQQFVAFAKRDIRWLLKENAKLRAQIENVPRWGAMIV